VAGSQTEKRLHEYGRQTYSFALSVPKGCPKKVRHGFPCRAIGGGILHCTAIFLRRSDSGCFSNGVVRQETLQRSVSRFWQADEHRFVTGFVQRLIQQLALIVWDKRIRLSVQDHDRRIGFADVANGIRCLDSIRTGLDGAAD
jgi:hypothetical protein